MSLVNNLSRRAGLTPAPSKLTIRENEIDALIDYWASTVRQPESISRLAMRSSILAGNSCFMGIPLQVVAA